MVVHGDRFSIVLNKIASRENIYRKSSLT